METTDFLTWKLQLVTAASDHQLHSLALFSHARGGWQRPSICQAGAVRVSLENDCTVDPRVSHLSHLFNKKTQVTPPPQQSSEMPSQYRAQFGLLGELSDI